MSLNSPGADFGFSSLSLSAGGAPSPGDQSWSSMDPSLVTTTSQRIMAGENTKLLTASQRDQVTQRLHVDQVRCAAAGPLCNALGTSLTPSFVSICRTPSWSV